MQLKLQEEQFSHFTQQIDQLCRDHQQMWEEIKKNKEREDKRIEKLFCLITYYMQYQQHNINQITNQHQNQ